ncbi:MAG: right-handed parallel beta-helix repeat-containing protein [Verrucomicrobiaceae bacterium]|nr:right-handed parallel beta-helix repeat-containing protein [Verrucomicrobiaceae bacterium]
MKCKLFFLALMAITLVCTEGILAREWVVGPDGSDEAAGTADDPFKTISKGADKAMAGDIILVRAGVYRERVAPPRGGIPGKPITFRGEKLGEVFIRGSERWQPEWRKHQGSVHFAVPKQGLFGDDAYVDSANPFLVELSSTPYGRDGKPEVERYKRGNANLVFTCGQVIVNGTPYLQMPFLGEVEKRKKTWTFMPATGRLYINFGGLSPDDQQVEITVRRRIFAPHVKGLGYIVVEGLVMEHCGNQYPTNFWNTPKWAQAGALGLRGGHHWIVRGNMIRYANSMAMDVGSGGGDNEKNSTSAGGGMAGHDNLIEGNYIVDNGAAGIVGANTMRMVIRGNVMLRNNTQGYIGPKRYEHAAIKCHDIKDGLIDGNYIADNPRNDGVWLDNQFPGTRVTRNVIVNNGVKGIFLEMSDYRFDAAMVDHNIVVGNGASQFYVHDASGATVIHNLFANSPPQARFGQGAYIYQVTARTKTGYHSLYNNLFINHKSMLDINYPSHRSGPQRIDHNVYDIKSSARAFIINSASDKPAPWRPDEFFKLVSGEVGTDGPRAISGGAKVALTLDEWRRFWKKHGLDNDGHSVARKGIKVTYDQKSLELKITMPFDPETLGSTAHRLMDRDFMGVPVPGDGTATVGPMQGLKQGGNNFRLWRGLPLLAEGELP